jgi:V8-like Glu-specific endopeptidase
VTVTPNAIDARNYPFIAQITTVFSRQTTGGTGTLIGPRLVLTAGHVVYDPTWGGDALRFLLTLGGPTRYQTSSTVWRTNDVWRNRDALLGTTRALSGADFGVVVLDAPIDALVRPLHVETTPQEAFNAMQLNVAGYPVPPHANGQTLFGASSPPLPDAFPEFQATRVFYPIQTLAGMSGGPLWDLEPRSQVRTLRGVHTSIVQGIGSALRITNNVLALIHQWQHQFRPA